MIPPEDDEEENKREVKYNPKNPSPFVRAKIEERLAQLKGEEEHHYYDACLYALMFYAQEQPK